MLLKRRDLTKKILVLMFVLLIKTVSFGQAINKNNYMPAVSPVSPKAFEFLKYTDVPVSKYTGIPNITIPIYVINTDAYSMPVSLSYHSNGFRVSEEAGWTGLGWNLNAGGSIVQVVNGFDDFGVFKNRDNELQPMVNATPGMPGSILNTCTTVNFAVQASEGGHPIVWPPNNGAINYQPNVALLNGTKDAEPDVFKFRAGNFSGDFLLDWQTETFKCITDANVKIEATASTAPQNFMITAPDGTRYYFEMKEQTTITKIAYEGNAGPPLSFPGILDQVSSRVYYLTSVISTNAELINFNYVQTAAVENYPSINESSVFNRKELIYPSVQGIVQPSIDSYFPNSEFFRIINYSRQNFSYLSSITFPSGKINFISSADRTDLIGARKLNSIEVLNSKDEIIKSIQFNYDYFTANTAGNNYDAYLQYPVSNPVYSTNKQVSELSQRLKLLSVKEFDKPAYQFEYHSEQLPKKTSVATDYWGYANGKSSNGSYLPNIWMNGIVDEQLTGIDNNRNSDFLSTRAAVMKKIVYPTGGSSSFEYELNTFDNFKITHDDYSTKTAVFLNDRNNPGDNLAQIFYADLPSVLYNGEMNINTFGPMSGSTTPSSAYIRLTVLQKNPENLNLVTTGIASFWATYHSTPFNQLGNYINNVVSDSKLLSFEWNQATNSYETFKLKTGEVISVLPQYIYIVHAYLDNSFGPQSNSSQGANASAYFTFLKNSSYPLSKGGGIRIKSIKTESNPLPPVIKSYTYFGGKLMSPLLYLTKNAVEYEHGNYFYPGGGMPAYYDEYKYRIVTSTANSASFYTPSANASGKYIGYDRVEETNSVLDNNQQLVGNLNGKIVEEYTNTPDVGVLDPTLFPSTGNPNASNPLNFIYPARKAAIENGLSAKISYYNSQNVIIKEIENNYTPTVQQCSYGRVAGTLRVQCDPFSVSSNAILKARVFGIGAYPIVGNKTLLGNSTLKEYSNGNMITSFISNSYDSRNQLSTTSFTNSEQNTSKTTYKYPYDYPSYSSLANVMITPVIEQKDEIVASGVSKQLSALRRDYFFTGGATQSGTWQLQAVFKGLGNNVPESDVVYDLYGESSAPDKYKLRQYHDKSGLVTSVIWGYAGQFPVAKVVGKSYADVLSQSGINLTVLNNLTSDNAAIKTELNKLYLLTNCLSTSYMYKPLVGIISEMDPRGRITNYEYDAYNRLALVKDHDGNILKKICYNYAGEVENCIGQVFTNDLQQATYTSTLCSGGLIAPTFTYTVPAGTYSSTIDKLTANQLAIAAMNTNGQAAANALPCLAPLNCWNKITAPYNITVTNSSGFNSTYAFYPGSSSTVLANLPVGTYNFSLSPMYGGSVSQELILNGITYTGVTISASNVNITASSTLTLQTPAASGPCSFTVSSGYSSPTSSISNNGTSVSGYFVFYSYSTMTQGNSYLVATVNGGCRPSVTRSFNCSYGGRNWTVTVYPSGQVYVQLAYGSASLSPYSTVSLSPFSYNL